MEAVSNKTVPDQRHGHDVFRFASIGQFHTYMTPAGAARCVSLMPASMYLLVDDVLLSLCQHRRTGHPRAHRIQGRPQRHKHATLIHFYVGRLACGFARAQPLCTRTLVSRSILPRNIKHLMRLAILAPMCAWYVGLVGRLRRPAHAYCMRLSSCSMACIHSFGETL
jgi:hypothetical protein